MHFKIFAFIIGTELTKKVFYKYCNKSKYYIFYKFCINYYILFFTLRAQEAHLQHGHAEQLLLRLGGDRREVRPGLLGAAAAAGAAAPPAAPPAAPADLQRGGHPGDRGPRRRGEPAQAGALLRAAHLRSGR